MIAQAERIIACWAMGLTQHKHAVATIQDLVNLLLLRGSIGKPGAGLCPVRGHSNVQGDRTMGIVERPPSGIPRRARPASSASNRRANMGSTRSKRSRRCSDGAAKVFFALGGNFLSATPDTNYTAAALAELPAHRARLDQAEPLAPRHRAHGADSAVPRADRTRHAEWQGTVRHDRELDGRGADLPADRSTPPRRTC